MESQFLQTRQTTLLLQLWLPLSLTSMRKNPHQPHWLVYSPRERYIVGSSRGQVKPNWHKLVCSESEYISPRAVKCLTAESTIKSALVCTKPTSSSSLSSSHGNITCSHHDKAEQWLTQSLQNIWRSNSA